MGQRPWRGRWPILPQRRDLSLICQVQSKTKRPARSPHRSAIRFESLGRQSEVLGGSGRRSAGGSERLIRGFGRPARVSGESSWGLQKNVNWNLLCGTIGHWHLQGCCPKTPTEQHKRFRIHIRNRAKVHSDWVPRLSFIFSRGEWNRDKEKWRVNRR